MACCNLHNFILDRGETAIRTLRKDGGGPGHAPVIDREGRPRDILTGHKQSWTDPKKNLGSNKDTPLRSELVAAVAPDMDDGTRDLLVQRCAHVVKIFCKN